MSEHDTSGDIYIPRQERIRDESDGAACVAWSLVGICVCALGFVVAVVWWGPQ